MAWADYEGGDGWFGDLSVVMETMRVRTNRAHQCWKRAARKSKGTQSRMRRRRKRVEANNRRN